MSEMQCPDENVVVAYSCGELDGEQKRAFEEHVDRCVPCTELLMELGVLLTGEGSVEGSKGVMRGLQRYVWGELLGRGGMGLVVEAWDTQLERRVALKMWRVDFAEQSHREQLRGRMLQEARALAKLSHPNILTVFEVFEHQERLMLVTEFIEGTSLDQSAALDAMDTSQVLELYAHLADALAHAHEQGVIHRDVKPSNIMLKAQGRPVLIDFGLATAAVSADEVLHTQLTETGAVLGTPAFMSPEQHMGQKATEASDIFSLCASLYHSLFGVRPFAGGTPQAVAMRAYAQEVQPPSNRREVPSKVLNLVQQGLRADPTERPSSMSELRDSLRLLTKETSSHRAPWLSAALLVVAFGAAALGLHMMQLSNKDPSAPSKPRLLQVLSESSSKPPVTSKPLNTPKEKEATKNKSSSMAKEVVAKAQGIFRLKVPPKQAGPNRIKQPSRSVNPALGKTKLSTPSAPPSPKPVVQGDVAGLMKAHEEARAWAYAHQPTKCRQALAPYKGSSHPAFGAAEAHCLFIEGKCSKAKAQMAKYLQASLSQGVVKTTIDGISSALCRPAASQREARLIWSLKPFASRAHTPWIKGSCQAHQRRALTALRAYKSLELLSDEAKEEVTKSIWFGFICARATNKKPACAPMKELADIYVSLKWPAWTRLEQEKKARRSITIRYASCEEELP